MSSNSAIATTRSTGLHFFQSATQSRIFGPAAAHSPPADYAHLSRRFIGQSLRPVAAPVVSGGLSPDNSFAMIDGQTVETGSIAVVCECVFTRLPAGSSIVATYIMLANWTDQGARQIKESPKRFETAKKELAEMGGEFKSFYMTMGEYDVAAVYEAPDDAVAARFTLLLGRAGAVRTKTLKAFPEAAYREIINSLN